jgi:hypothetical protein
VSDEPPLPGIIPLDDNGNAIRGKVSLSDIELLKSRGLWTDEQLRDAVAVEQSLPDSIWDRSIILERIIVETLLDPRRDFDRHMLIFERSSCATRRWRISFLTSWRRTRRCRRSGASST